MSDLPSSVLAIFCSDLHLSHKSPIARSAEDDWYEAMLRPLVELRTLQQRYKCPVICAGDIFDTWRSPPELINFALDNLPSNMICIPGQHDLPYHSFKEVKRSAYSVLVNAGKIVCIAGKSMRLSGTQLQLTGVPWGEHIPEPEEFDGYNVAVVHRYIWIKGKNYINASRNSHASRVERRQQYDVMVFGDNHKGFTLTPAGTGEAFVINCGGFMRRKIDEIKYQPRIVLLSCEAEGLVVTDYMLDCSQDRLFETNRLVGEEVAELDSDPEVSGFLRALRVLSSDSLDFRQAVQSALAQEPVDYIVRTLIEEAIDIHGI